MTFDLTSPSVATTVLGRSSLATVWRMALVSVLMSGVLACSSTAERPKPKDLSPSAALIGVKQAWSARTGEVAFPMAVSVAPGELTLAGSDGTVLALDARTGAEKWRRQLAEPLAAGVGGDGKMAAVVTRNNQLVAVDGTRELWRQKLTAQTYTAPLVAGGRVFVVTADRTVTAYDGPTGRRLWQQTKAGEPLILKQPGVLLAVGDTLVVGQAGRLAGLNPNNGSPRWEAPIASSRGTNDIERLVDLVGPVSRVEDTVCARAFQSNVGCVNATRGTQIWTQVANGFEGLHGDATRVVGSESDGKLVAWRRTDGQRLWSSDRLQYRNLTAPLVLGRSTVVGDGTGLLHFVSSEDGSALSRVATDGSAIVGGPILIDGTLVVVTKNGGVFGFVPE
jgi:outer membrane protein assembly factor BamB